MVRHQQHIGAQSFGLPQQSLLLGALNIAHQQHAAARNHAGLLALVALPMGESAAPHYVLGTDNFYAITRYNWSSQYAMAVIDLAQAIEAAAQSQP